MKRVLALLLLSPAVLPAESNDPAELLRRVAAAYARISTYVINVTMTKSGGALVAGGERALAAGPVLGSRPSVNRLLLARSGTMYHYEISNPMSRLTWITNGQKTWIYRPDLKEYIEQDAEPWPAQIGPGPGLPGTEWEYVSKFRAIAGMEGRAKLLKDDVPPDRVCLGNTALIELSLGDAKEPATEQLRIDTRTALLCQSTLVAIRRVRVTPVEYTTVTQWTYQQLSGPLDPKLFVFDPPKRAKRVEHFRALSQPMTDW